MRYAVISDIHANLAAFTAVLEDIERMGGVEEIWCLGDVVGYGPDPHQCLGLLRQHRHVCVAGNHDLAAAGKMDTSVFNPDAAAACSWTAEQLTAEDLEYLGNLPLTARRGEFTLVHGSPRGPIWEYVLSIDSAADNFPCFQTRYCLIGHSHRPMVFVQTPTGQCISSPFLADGRIVLGGDRLIVNPGGVGQPRDGDPRASYALYDDNAMTATLRRVEYDIGVTQARMAAQRLPLSLAARLSYGI